MLHADAQAHELIKAFLHQQWRVPQQHIAKLPRDVAHLTSCLHTKFCLLTSEYGLARFLEGKKEKQSTPVYQREYGQANRARRTINKAIYNSTVYAVKTMMSLVRV